MTPETAEALIEALEEVGHRFESYANTLQLNIEKWLSRVFTSEVDQDTFKEQGTRIDCLYLPVPENVTVESFTDLKQLIEPTFHDMQKFLELLKKSRVALDSLLETSEKENHPGFDEASTMIGEASGNLVLTLDYLTGILNFLGFQQPPDVDENFMGDLIEPEDGRGVNVRTYVWSSSMVPYFSTQAGAFRKAAENLSNSVS